MPNGLHQVRLAHSDTAVEKKRVIGLGRTFSNCLAGCVRELITASDDEGIEGIARIKLGSAVPIESGLTSTCSGRGHRKSAIVTDRRGGRIIFRRDKLYVLVLQTEIIDGFLDQVSILVAYVAEFRCRHAHEQNAPAGMAIPSRFQPGVIGVPVNLFFERIQDAQPRVGNYAWTWNGHKHSLLARATLTDPVSLQWRRSLVLKNNLCDWQRRLP